METLSKSSMNSSLCKTKETIIINLKNIEGNVVSYEVKCKDTIESFKTRVAKDINMSEKGSARMILVYSGKVLKANTTFEQNGIMEEDTIHLLIRLLG